MEQFGIAVESDVLKVNEERREVSGWASVVSVDGVPVVDRQGDVVEMDELRKAAHDFVSKSRAGKVMHQGEQRSDIVQSVIIDDDFAKAHGITHGKRGWWITMAINHDRTWELAKSGRLPAFSIGGRGVRVPMEDSPT